ncbi:MAG: TetR family transcriptional regulator C-terminal domain-containing protein [Rhizobiales bacterium]|nr:TetR family transcriptional regulator C-terminal domain-containing protein [Hyphomicrobiales bacterium]
MQKKVIKKSDIGIRSKNEAKILEGAVIVFSRKGLDGTRLTDIATECNLPKANVYYYFSNKTEIYERLIENVLAGWDKAFEHIKPDLEPEDAISEYVKAKLEYARNNIIESKFFTFEMLRGGQFLSKKQRQHIVQVTRKYEQVVEYWISEGKLKPLDTRHFFIILWASTEFYANYSNIAELTLGKHKLTKTDFEQAHKSIVQNILNGCLPQQ